MAKHSMKAKSVGFNAEPLLATTEHASLLASDDNTIGVVAVLSD